MKIYVSPYWMDAVWAPIAEGNKVDDLLRADMSLKKNFDLLVNQYLIPYFHSELLPENQVKPNVLLRIKESWRYGMNYYTEKELERAFDRNLPPFSIPSDVRQFYIHVWQAVFPNEFYKLKDKSLYHDLKDTVQVGPWQWLEHKTRLI